MLSVQEAEYLDIWDKKYYLCCWNKRSNTRAYVNELHSELMMSTVVHKGWKVITIYKMHLYLSVEHNYKNFQCHEEISVHN